MVERRMRRHEPLPSRLASIATEWTGSTPAFILAATIILVWLITGPIFHYSDTWQLVINTGTTIVTFLMVFLIQRAQNKDALAVQLKLSELVAAIDGASNRLISVEDLSEDELKVLRIHFQRLAEMARRDEDIHHSHSVEEAEARHALKRDRRRKPGQKIAEKLKK
jgi:low affinity Fe/Cu permease